MRRWWCLLLLLAGWTAAGSLIAGTQQIRGKHQVNLQQEQHRIVSLAPDLTEILFALGLDDRIVGVTLDSDYPPAAKTKTKVGTFWQPNIEAIIATKPDLVITLGFEQQKELAARLRRIGYNCVTLNIDTIKDFFEALSVIDAATGRQPQVSNFSDKIKSEINEITAKAVSPKRARVLWIVQREPLRVAGRNTFINEIIELAGGQNAIGPTMHQYPPIGAEQVIACKADVIIEPTMFPKNTELQNKQAHRYWGKYTGLPAVLAGRIYVINGDPVSRLGPRLPEGIKSVARCLRPELFAD
jgi:iron complex transport system substrate-binding protein